MEEQRIFLGNITKEETDAIEYILERLAGLEELQLIVENSVLEKKLQKEIQELKSASEEWWQKMCKKYNWNIDDTDEWEVDCSDSTFWKIQQ